jgi:hypothetical protein
MGGTSKDSKVVKENFHGIRMAREIFIVLTVCPFLNVFPLAQASKNTFIANSSV